MKYKLLSECQIQKPNKKYFTKAYMNLLDSAIGCLQRKIFTPKNKMKSMSYVLYNQNSYCNLATFLSLTKIGQFTVLVQKLHCTKTFILCTLLEGNKYLRST